MDRNSTQVNLLTSQLNMGLNIHQTAHILASPMAERAEQIAKNMLKQKDVNLALMIYRDTPVTTTGYELMLARQVRTTLPVLPSNFKSHWSKPSEVKTTKIGPKTKVSLLVST